MGENTLMLSGFLADEARVKIAAFEGFTGPLDAVQAGDVQLALEILADWDRYSLVIDSAVRRDDANQAAAVLEIIKVTRTFLARLQPKDKP